MISTGVPDPLEETGFSFSNCCRSRLFSGAFVFLVFGFWAPIILPSSPKGYILFSQGSLNSLEQDAEQDTVHP